MIGVYMIQCKINNKIYIGSSIDINCRKRKHINLLNGKKHINKYLQDDWNKYLEENFEFSILKECYKENLLENEIYYIELYKSNNKDFGYNIKTGNRGMKHSTETKLKIGMSSKGNKVNLGRKHSIESKINMSNSKKGSKYPKSKINIIQSKEILEKLNNGKSVKELTVEYNCSRNIIQCIRHGKHWTIKIKEEV